MTSPKPKKPKVAHVQLTAELDKRIVAAQAQYSKGMPGVSRSQVLRWVIALGLEQVEKRGVT